MTTGPTWFVHDVPITGDPSRLLARQAEIHVPGKVIRGLRLRLEWPVIQGASIPASLTESIVNEWQAAVQPVCTTDSSSQGFKASMETVRRGLTEAGVSWTQIDDRIEWPCPLNGRAHRYVGTICRSWLRVQCEVVSLPADSPDCRTALAHYLVALNSRLRGCRVSLDDRRITVEAVLWADALGDQFSVALATLQQTAALVTREISWLRRNEVVDRYRAFHHLTKGGDIHEHERSSGRLEPVAGRR